MAKIRNPRGDGRDADVLDDKCIGRPCLHIGENKGSFVQGRGYTSYHRRPWLECWTRHLHGCPHPLPDMEPENVRCCRVPDFPEPRKGKTPSKQRCRTCGQSATGRVLEIRRGLPEQENTPCKHLRVHLSEDELLAPWEKWLCPDCLSYWTHKPEPREPGESYRDLLDRKLGLVP
jgi:hypothetical protein